MASENYLQRRLKVQGKLIAEDILLEQGRCIVILAEPGAGKTELIKSLASQLGCNVVRASIFLHQTRTAQGEVLLIDGIDEVAKIDESSVDKIIVKAGELNPSAIVLTSRGSEWDESRYNQLLSDVLHAEVITSRLSPLETNEQETLFEKLFPDQSFEKFYKEVGRLDLVGLLGNPLFLNLFAEAFVETGGTLTSKLEAYQSAIFRLAKEQNPNQPNKNRPSIANIVSLAEEVYAKLLLSGASGVSVDEGAADINYPYFYSLTSHPSEVLKCVLDTRLFRNESASHFVPVHKVVAEYCAANYLIRRLNDANDLLSVNRLLSLLAPNRVTREELRGLIAWMAALALLELQIQLIKLDPYAILANGDPSQLSVEAKKVLIQEVCDLADKDPYFRRGDNWRSFNIDGFFTSDIIDDVRGILLGADEQSHLGGLFLELLTGSSAGIQLVPEYESILRNKIKSRQTRSLAVNNLLDCEGWDYNACFSDLCAERSKASIDLAAKIALKIKAETVGKANLKGLMDAAFELFKVEDFDIYTFNLFLRSLSLETTVWLLEEFHGECRCSCAAKHSYQCDCRDGSSKILGELLDKYFELTAIGAAHDVNKIWHWMRNLKFERTISNRDSASVKFLRNNPAIRNQIQLKAFEGVTNEDELWKSRMSMTVGDAHAGLQFWAEDWEFIVCNAFQTNNVALWKQFYSRHNVYAEEKGTDEYRSLLREHAKEKPIFMKTWAARERQSKEYQNENPSRRSNYKRKEENRRQLVDSKNKHHLLNNQKIVREGRHWGWLDLFTHHYLNDPSELSRIGTWVDDISLPFESLRNSIPFIEENLPTFDELVEMKINARSSRVLHVLYAACMVHLREKNSLSDINLNTLKALQTDSNVHWSAINEEDREAFRNEVERLVFHSTEAVEQFAREYFEPQLSRKGNHSPSLWWLTNNSAFETLRETIPLEWLEKYPEMPFVALDKLFNMTVQFGDVEALKLLIDKRCSEIQTSWPYGPPIEQQKNLRDFWYTRSLFFIDRENAFVWEALSEFSNTIFMVRNLEGAWSHDRRQGWPKLSASKIYLVLDAFIEKWPKVHLPSSHGSSSPPEEKAYRFLDSLVWRIGNDISEASSTICAKILTDTRFSDFHQSILHIQYNLQRDIALRDFNAPSPTEVAAFFDEIKIATVEDLRALVLELLHDFQRHLETSPTNPVQVFYDNGVRVDENTASQRVVDYLTPRLNPLGVTLNIEEYITPQAERCDIVLTFNISGHPKKLVIEAKGQWHKMLYTAATTQLYQRYSHHPAAEQQGVYLVYWYGVSEKVANRKIHHVRSPEQLKQKIEESISANLRPYINVVVLNLTSCVE